MSGTAEGVPLTIRLTLLDAGSDCRPLAGYAVYVWQSDRDGNYSLYDLPDQNYLRGVQEADASGLVTFESIFPACYFYEPISTFFWPHIHLEIYPSLASATAGTNAVLTSQLALPKAASNEVYATSGYEQSAINLSQVELGSDAVFNDGYALQVPTLSGSVASGYTAAIDVGISV
jgi:protocatechuate 3,4-dioxygenase beta subunit